MGLKDEAQRTLLTPLNKRKQLLICLVLKQWRNCSSYGGYRSDYDSNSTATTLYTSNFTGNGGREQDTCGCGLTMKLSVDIIFSMQLF
uniref:Uncharacterized protein n=1 Tax=Glossina palpalis gambiensis TaxID=67801 RepID=A0A1B0BS02_9MUSC